MRKLRAAPNALACLLSRVHRFKQECADLQFMENNRHHFLQADPQAALAAIREQGA